MSAEDWLVAAMCVTVAGIVTLVVVWSDRWRQ